MKRYRCHKIVQAFKVVRFEVDADGVTLYGSETELHRLPGARFESVKATDIIGGYCVFYGGDNDYVSFSPGKPFEDGYSEIAEEPRRTNVPRRDPRPGSDTTADWSPASKTRPAPSDLHD